MNSTELRLQEAMKDKCYYRDLAIQLQEENKKLQSQLNETLEDKKFHKEIAYVLKSNSDRYRASLQNLADYVLTGEYKKETLRVLGLLDEEEE